MPIVRSVDSVHIEYTIPSDIKILITDDFLNVYINLFELQEFHRTTLQTKELSM